MATQRERMAAALWGLMAGDALAMPVHWYYNLGQLKRDFPNGIQGYEAPKQHLPGSILNLSSTGGGGRGSDKGNIIGDVINHGKQKYWKRGADYHYHATLVKGENTLEAQLGRLLLRTVAEHAKFDKHAWLRAFDKFLTTPGSHNDVYASTYIRMFFVNRQAGKLLEECADNDHHNTDAIDALTLVGPVAFSDISQARLNVTDYILAGRKSTALISYTMIYTDMIESLLTRNDELSPCDALKQVAISAGRHAGVDIAQSVGRSSSDPMCACYITSAFPAMLFFLYKYAHDPAACLLASASAGGENVARGAVLGTLLGLAYGTEAWNGERQWIREGLKDKDALENEIEAFLTVSESRQIL